MTPTVISPVLAAAPYTFHFFKLLILNKAVLRV